MTACAYCGIGVEIMGSETAPEFWASCGWDEEMQAYVSCEPAHLDHVIPESKNGPTSLDNTVIACPPCNMAKGASAFGDPGFLAWLQERRGLVLERQRAEASA
jgi:5-methylcytosine-specific restriction endonuclease McrA